jgi:hypothetical protein
MVQPGLFRVQFPSRDKLDILLARFRSIVGDHNEGHPNCEIAIETRGHNGTFRASIIPTHSQVEIRRRFAQVSGQRKRCECP